MNDYSKLWQGRVESYLFIYLFEGGVEDSLSLIHPALVVNLIASHVESTKNQII